jgi:hypothetical protein
LERRVGIVTNIGRLYPNLYTLLVGPPAIGKSVIIDKGKQMVLTRQELRLAPASVTRAAMEDFLLHKTTSKIIDSGDMISYHSAIVFSSEFGNFVKEYDNDWINFLNEIYDCPNVFEAMTRGGGTKKIDSPHMVILAGTQPQYLHHLLPTNAYGMGFTSRFVMIYGKAEDRYKPHGVFGKVARDMATEHYLEHGMKVFESMSGDFMLTPEAQNYIEEQDKVKWPPEPIHPKLFHYNGRRLVHILKLSQIFCASRQAGMTITLEDVVDAKNLLLATEKVMPNIFSEMVTSGVAELNIEFVNFAIAAYMKSGRKPVLERTLLEYMATKLPQIQLRPTLALLVQLGYLIPEIFEVAGRKYPAYVPQSDGDKIRGLMEEGQ